MKVLFVFLSLGVCYHLSSQVLPTDYNKQNTTADTLPLTELGNSQWKNYSGGLYPSGFNTRPALHDSNGKELALQILPLDTFGNPDDQKGKIVLLSIGMSNATQEFSVFKTIADTFKNKNPKLIIVDGAQGGQTASIIKNPLANFWTVVNQRIYLQKVHPLQVQSVWLKEANSNPMDAFPKHALDLKSDLKAIVLVLKEKFPNLKLIYFSSRIYGGYATTTLNPEPYAYESGFSVKWLIEDQINGDSTLNYHGSSAKTAWLSWGPYLWAKGTTPRQDGLSWLRTDFVTDGTHPSNEGRIKVAHLLLDFFSSDSTTIAWFLNNSITATDNFLSEKINKLKFFQNIPNPFNQSTILSWYAAQNGLTKINLYDYQGCLINTSSQYSQTGLNRFELNGSDLVPGIYICKIESALYSDWIELLRIP